MAPMLAALMLPYSVVNWLAFSPTCCRMALMRRDDFEGLDPTLVHNPVWHFHHRERRGFDPVLQVRGWHRLDESGCPHVTYLYRTAQMDDCIAVMVHRLDALVPLRGRDLEAAGLAAFDVLPGHPPA